MSSLSFGKNKTLPIVLQSESGECGLACVVMIANYYGKRSSLFDIRSQCTPSSRGATLRTVMKIAETLGFSTRAVRVDVNSLQELKCPMILHWNFNHFVVLKCVKHGKYIIHDPATGIRKYTKSELENRFTGVALELLPSIAFETGAKSKKLTLSTFWKDANGLIGALVQVMLLSLLIQAFALATPLYLQNVVDNVLIEQDRDILFILAVGFFFISLFTAVTKAVRGFANLYLTNQLTFIIGDGILKHLIRLPLSYFEKRHLGDIVSRFESSKAVSKFLTESTVVVFIDGLLSIFALLLMFLYSVLLTTVVLVATIICAVIRWFYFSPIRSSTLETINANAVMDTNFIETIRTIQGIKLAGKEGDRQHKWRNKFTDTLNSSAQVSRLTIYWSTLNSIVVGAEYVLTIYLGSLLIISGSLTIGMLYAFLVYRTHFSSAITSLINQLIEYFMLGLHFERLEDITHTEPEILIDSNSNFTIPIKGNLALVDATYSYSEFDPKIIQNFNVSIDAGEMVAIYGDSGIGKTTILKLLMGLLSPVQGKLMVDGRPLNRVGLKSYRNSFAAVMQGDALFNGTVRDNITFLDPQPDIDHMVKCAQLAFMHDDIMNTPMNYDSLIGDLGTTLSMGQAQRIMLARALYSNPKTLFLDEGTAHVDSETEDKIFDNLRELGVTCVFVTHRKSLLSIADKCILWENSGPKVTEPREMLVLHN